MQTNQINTNSTNKSATSASPQNQYAGYFAESGVAAIVGSIENKLNKLIRILKKCDGDFGKLALTFAEKGARDTRIAGLVAAGVSLAGAAAMGYGAFNYGSIADENITSLKNNKAENDVLSGKMKGLDDKISKVNSNLVTNDSEKSITVNKDQKFEKPRSANSIKREKVRLEQEKKSLVQQRKPLDDEKETINKKHQEKIRSNGDKFQKIYGYSNTAKAGSETLNSVKSGFDAKLVKDQAKQKTANDMSSAAQTTENGAQSGVDKALNTNVFAAATSASR